MSFITGYEQLPPRKAKQFRLDVAKRFNITDQQVYNLKNGKSGLTKIQWQYITRWFEIQYIYDVYDDPRAFLDFKDSNG